jgi:hypothetical protein
MTFTIHRGDTAPAFEKNITDSLGHVVDLSSVDEVEFHMEDEFENVVVTDDTSGNVFITDESAGVVEYEWKSGDTEEVGSYNAEFVVEYSDGTKQSFPYGTEYRIVIIGDIDD